jgi:hypothetical protein
VLLKWVRQCASIEVGIQKALGVVMKVESECQRNGPAWAGVWPEIVNFVKLKRTGGAMPRTAIKQIIERVQRDVQKSDMTLVTDLLATCVMLPSKHARLQGWVNFHSEEYNNE